jgi:hypothetical protein
VKIKMRQLEIAKDGMGWVAGVLCALTLAPFLAAQAEPAASSGSALRELRTAPIYPNTSVPSSTSPLREITDPHSGARWFLFRDQDHPGAPGRLVREGSPTDQTVAPANPEPAATARQVVVRAGDRLDVEEHTARFNAWFEASALGSASAGSTLNVRLKLSGKIVRALVTAPGSATMLAPEAAVHP